MRLCCIVQIILIACIAIVGRCEVMDITWPTAPTVPQNNNTYITTSCYKELTEQHLNKPILINHTYYDWRRPCLIRIPTKTEVVFTMARLHERSSLRVFAGISRNLQLMATEKLQKRPNSQLTLPVYVGCKYATIVFRPFTIEDYLLFIVRPARPNLIAEEDENVCTRSEATVKRSRLRRRRDNINSYRL
ncbi:hypothetical protein M3Y98_00106400 [Aphelenchoides besseyi]|nr:hypothetical protein M3Y98_00106400 [Aphelenchoides besseyi]KAI6194488.1 hypothetical protein M3Y96_01130100 [Aphelenchoides besseyi]